MDRCRLIVFKRRERVSMAASEARARTNSIQIDDRPGQSSFPCPGGPGDWSEA
jgi:hypothetical protein